jgi:hypothetical protein
VFKVTFIFVTVQLFTKKHKPITFQIATLLLFLKDFSLEMDAIFAITANTCLLEWQADVSADTVLDILDYDRVKRFFPLLFLNNFT